MLDAVLFPNDRVEDLGWKLAAGEASGGQDCPLWCCFLLYKAVVMYYRVFNVYPLVNVHITMERSTMLLMGTLTISMAIFNSYVSLPEGKYA